MRRTLTVLFIVSASLAVGLGADKPYRAPKIWDEAKLRDWELPLGYGGPTQIHLTKKDTSNYLIGFPQRPQ